jgi:hypothetical protein
VVLLTVEGGGHVWPGGAGAPADINASEEVWAFLKRFSLSSSTALSFHRAGQNPRVSARYAAGGVHVGIDEKTTAVRIVDISGRTVAAWHVGAQPGTTSEITLPFAGANGPVYLLAVEGGGSFSAGPAGERAVKGPQRTH